MNETTEIKPKKETKVVPYAECRHKGVKIERLAHVSQQPSPRKHVFSIRARDRKLEKDRSIQVRSLHVFSCSCYRLVVIVRMLRRGMLTRAQEEQMRADTRRKEYQLEDQMKLVAQDKLLRANVAADERVENKRHARRLQQEVREQEMQERIVASERERALREKQLEQEEMLAKVCGGGNARGKRRREGGRERERREGREGGRGG